MAHKNKEEVRAYYETNYASIEEVAKEFQISKRTIYEWVKNEEWVAGKHIPKNLPTGNDLLKDEFGSRLTRAKQNMESEIKTSLISEGISEAIASSVAKKKSDELVLKAMSVEFFDSKATETLLIAKNAFEKFASANLDNPKAQREIISMSKTLSEMYASVKATIYGKSPEVNVQIANITNENDFSNLSEQELLAIIHQESKDE